MVTKAIGAVLLSLLVLGPPANTSPSMSEQDFQIEVVASNLTVPWSMAFTPDGRLLFTERPGRIRSIENGVMSQMPLAELNVAATSEAGLLGIAVDPDFRNNRHVYVYYTYREGSELWNRVARLTDKGGRLVDETIIVDRIPGAGIHDGGRIKFGPDEKLYVTTGDAARGQLSQDLSSIAGKILRINRDGTPPPDNPFPDSPVYTLGHRNPQGIDWHPVTKKTFISEHGPSGHDEVNVLEAGKNYGWPTVVGHSNDQRFVNPLIETGTDTWAPSGLAFYTGDALKEWKGRIFIAALRGQHLRMIVLTSDLTAVETHTALFRGVYGRLRDVVQGPDGFLYFSTSNRDGRGSPVPDDDKILRVKPTLIRTDGSEGITVDRYSLSQLIVIASATIIISSGALALLLKRRRAD